MDEAHPVFAASRSDDVEALKLVLASDGRAFEKSFEDGVTSVHVACIHGSLHVLNHILRMDAGVTELRDAKGFSPILRAAEYGHLACLRALLTANPQSISHVDDLGFCALHRAARNGHLSICECLLKEFAELVHIRDVVNRETALFHACLGGHAEIAKLLLECNNSAASDVNVLDYTPLFSAVSAVAEGFGNARECLQVLLLPKYGANANWRSSITGLTPLCLAIDLRAWDAIVILIQLGGADPDLPCSPRQPTSPLSFALLRNDAELIRAFEQALGADLIQQRLCELSSQVSPWDIVGRHLQLAGQEDDELYFCVECWRKYWLFGEIHHVLRSLNTGRELTLVLKRGTNQGQAFKLVPDASFPLPLDTSAGQ